MLSLLVEGQSEFDLNHLKNGYDFAPLSFCLICVQIFSALLACQLVICCILYAIDAVLFSKKCTNFYGTVCNTMVCPLIQHKLKCRTQKTSFGEENGMFKSDLDTKDTRISSCCSDTKCGDLKSSTPRFCVWKSKLSKASCPVCKLVANFFTSNRKSCSSRCDVHCTWAAFYKLHLPPPLPLRRPQSKSSNRGCEDNSASTSSEVREESSSSEIETGSTTILDSSNAARSDRLRHVSPVLTHASLIDLTRMRQWSRILQVSHLSRKQAKYKDANSLMPLHWACSGTPPVEVVTMLLSVYPSAVRKTDDNGSTPLHFATHYSASVEVIEVLLKAYPESIRRLDRYGRSPLFHAVDRKACLEVLRMLVKADPSMITKCLQLPKTLHSKDKSEDDDESKMTKFLNPGMELTRAEATLSPLHQIWASSKKEIVRMQKSSLEYVNSTGWISACMLLDVAWQVFNQERFGKSRDISVVSNYGKTILHAAIELDLYLPEFVVPVLVQTYPALLQEMDPYSGQLPLGFLTGRNSWSNSRHASLVGLLANAFPPAASHRDKDGRSPLALAISTKSIRNDVVKILFRYSPESLQWRERKTGLPPVLVAAASSNKINFSDEFGSKDHLVKETRLGPQNSEKSCDVERLDLIYELLRKDPSICLASL